MMHCVILTCYENQIQQHVLALHGESSGPVNLRQDPRQHAQATSTRLECIFTNSFELKYLTDSSERSSTAFDISVRSSVQQGVQQGGIKRVPRAGVRIVCYLRFRSPIPAISRRSESTSHSRMLRDSHPTGAIHRASGEEQCTAIRWTSASCSEARASQIQSHTHLPIAAIIQPLCPSPGQSNHSPVIRVIVFTPKIRVVWHDIRIQVRAGSGGRRVSRIARGFAGDLARLTAR